MDILNILSEKMGNDFAQKVGSKLGIESNQAQSAINMAIPFITKALSKNTSTNEGAESLMNAIKKKHNGEVFNQLDDLISHPENGEGSGIMKHLFKDKADKIGSLIGSKSGIDTKSGNSLMQILTPMIMGAIGKESATGNLDISNLFGIFNSATEKADQNSSIPMQMVNSFLDQDGDGEITDDLMNMSKKFIGKLFK